MSVLSSRIKNKIKNILAENKDESIWLENSLRLLSKWRSLLIQNTLLQHHETLVMCEPLKGLDFLAQSAEGRGGSGKLKNWDKWKFCLKV